MVSSYKQFPLLFQQVLKDKNKREETINQKQSFYKLNVTMCQIKGHLYTS